MTIGIAAVIFFFGLILGSGITGMAHHPNGATKPDAIILGLEVVGFGLALIIGISWILVGLIFVALGIGALVAPIAQQ